MSDLNMKFRPMDTAPKDGSEIVLVFAAEAEVLGRPCGRARAAKWCGTDWSIAYWKRNPPIGWLPLLDTESDVRKERDLLRAALEKVVGASSRDELEQMWTLFNRAPRDDDMSASMAAIEALLATLPEGA